MEEQAPSARPSRGANISASKSTHVIDLRQSAGRPVAAPPPKPVRPARVARKAPATSARKVAPPPTYAQAAAPASRASQAPQVPAAAAPAGRADAVPADFFDAPPPRRRFWPAFWRFLLLLIILGLLICAGVYLYLKFYNP